LVDKCHADAEEDCVELGVGFDHEDLEDHDVLWSEKACRQLIGPDYVEIDTHARKDAKSDQYCLHQVRLDLEDHVGNPRHDNKELELARRVPAPIVAAFVRDDVTGDEIDGHGEDGPPVVVTIAEALLIGEPAGTAAEVRADLPADEEDKIVDGGHAHVAE